MAATKKYEVTKKGVGLRDKKGRAFIAEVGSVIQLTDEQAEPRRNKIVLVSDKTKALKDAQNDSKELKSVQAELESTKKALEDAQTECADFVKELEAAQAEIKALKEAE